MATKKDETKTNEEVAYTTPSGVAFTGEVVTGTDNGLDLQKQGQKARGELDENGNPKPAPAAKESTSTASAKAANDARSDQDKVADLKHDERIKSLQESGAIPATATRIKPEKTLYRGWITASAVASATGEKVSMKWEQASPVTEDGLFYSFRQYHPSAIRDTFEVDPKNETDPTLRTHLEVPRG